MLSYSVSDCIQEDCFSDTSTNKYHYKPRKEAGGTVNQKKNQDHLDLSTIKKSYLEEF